MSHKERLIRALSSGREGMTLENVKFFLGNNRNITQEALCNEAANALAQVSLGQVKHRSSIDGDLPKNSVEQFLK